MGRGTWYYSLRVFLEIVDVFVRSEFEISSWHGARVDVRTCLLGGAIDGSEANRIIRDSNFLEYSQDSVGFTPRRRIGFRMELVQGATPICEGSCRLTSLERQEVWNDCRSYKVRVGSNGNLLWEVSVLHGGVEKRGVRVACEDDHGVSKGREDVREVFQQRGSGSKRKLSRCRRNQMGNEPILALPEGADDFVVYYDARSKDLEAAWKRGEGEVLMKDAWRTWLWVVEGLTLERCSTFGKKDKLESSYVGPFDILGWIGPIVRLRISIL
ncbi:hypothetical protein Tco_0121077 [Tanacetum coccineum]